MIINNPGARSGGAFQLAHHIRIAKINKPNNGDFYSLQAESDWMLVRQRCVPIADDGITLIETPADHLAFLRRTGLVADIGGFVFAHAGLDTRLSVADNLADPDPNIVLWTRKHIGADLSAWERPVVVGHTPVAEVLDVPELLAIDTGAVFTHRPGLGRLTAVVLPERRLISVATVDVVTR